MPSLHALVLAVELSLLASIVHLDRVVVFQSLFHRPVFLAPLLGALSGNLEQAVWVAVFCEFASLLTPPTGTDLPADESGWAATAMIAFVLLPDGIDNALLPIILLSSIVLPVMRNAEIATRNGNGRLAEHAISQQRLGDHVPYKRLVFASIIGQMLLVSLICLVCAGAVVAAYLLIIGIENRYAIPFQIPAMTLMLALPLWFIRRSPSIQHVRPYRQVLLWLGGATAGLLLAVWQKGMA